MEEIRKGYFEDGQIKFEWDYKDDSAVIVGELGAERVVLIHGPNAMSFVERVPSGIVQSTSIYLENRQDLVFRSVHSRHTIVGDDVAVSQLYGRCYAR